MPTIRRSSALLGSIVVASVLIAAAMPSTTSAADAERIASAERLALRLLDCTRTGGWVRPDGTCRGFGSGRYSVKRKPLDRHRPLGTEVAWPWAATLAAEGACAHELPGMGP